MRSHHGSRCTERVISMALWWIFYKDRDGIDTIAGSIYAKNAKEALRKARLLHPKKEVWVELVKRWRD